MGRNITKQDLKAREMTVFGTIPGMMELMQASPAQREEVEAQYPDAVFAVVIATSLFNHNRELSEIANVKKKVGQCWKKTDHLRLKKTRPLRKETLEKK